MHILCTLSAALFDDIDQLIPKEHTISFVPFEKEALEQALPEADCWFASSLQPLGREYLALGRKLRLIQTLGVGFNNIDIAFAKQRGIYVCNSKGSNGHAVAEHAVGLMLAGLRRLRYYDRQASASDTYAAAMPYKTSARLHELGSRIVGLIGLGETGGATARLLQAFGCKVYYYKRNRVSAETERQLQVTYLPFDELIATCNVISLHVPSTPETVSMIGAAQFASMPEETLLINVARGEVVDTAALAHALSSGRLLGAALDTLSPEPPPPDHPLLHLEPEARDRLTVTPHIAGVTVESKAASLHMLLENIRRLTQGGTPHNIVNGL